MHPLGPGDECRSSGRNMERFVLTPSKPVIVMSSLPMETLNPASTSSRGGKKGSGRDRKAINISLEISAGAFGMLLKTRASSGSNGTGGYAMVKR